MKIQYRISYIWSRRDEDDNCITTRHELVFPEDKRKLAIRTLWDYQDNEMYSDVRLFQQTVKEEEITEEFN